MSKIFITGSTAGLGFMAAEQLISEGHEVLLHARNPEKAETVMEKLPRAMGVVTGDLSSIKETKNLADQVNGFGRMDSIIHNAGIGYRAPKRVETEDGLPHVFAI